MFRRPKNGTTQLARIGRIIEVTGGVMYLKSILTLLLSLVALVAPACSSSQVRVGFVGSQFGNRMDFDYDLFSGQEQKTLNLDQDQVLDLNFDIQVDDGSLTLQLIDEDGNVSWEESFLDDSSGSVDLQIDDDGLYEISINGQKTKGGFEIDWELH
jgi:hypothetical protein